MAKMKITQTKSLIGCTERQRRTMEALGLGKISSSALVEDQPQMVGMVNKVRHLIKVEEIK